MILAIISAICFLTLMSFVYGMYPAVPPKPAEAVKWLYQASNAGYTRAQYQLALCLHQGRGLDRNLPEAVCSFFPVHYFS